MKKWKQAIAILLTMTFIMGGCSNGTATSKENADSSAKGEEIVDESDSTSSEVANEDEESTSGETIDESDMTEEELNEQQRNSVAMLNYLAALTQEINDKKNNRMFLEEAYAALINNTNPESVDDQTQEHLESLLDIIEKYRTIEVKRERLKYLYEQNKARALRQAVPNPLGLLSAASSMDVKRMVAAVAYMAVDSFTSYKDYNNEIDQEFMKDGWELTDSEEETLHESRKRAFMFMITMVRENNLPGELALNESNIEEFVKYKNKDNLEQKYVFLNSNQKTYNGFGNYWIELAKVNYEKGKYKDCIDAIEKYRKLKADYLRKDYQLAQVLPLVIESATEIYKGKEYINYVESNVNDILENTENLDWSLRYFAAQMYLDLFAKTKDVKYEKKAYQIALDNVNYLVEEQEKLNSRYLNEVQLVSDEDAKDKDEKKKIKAYNKELEAKREVELPAIYEPLEVNCDLLFALAKELKISNGEKATIEGMLKNGASSVFLPEPVKLRYSFSGKGGKNKLVFEKDEITIPVSLLSEGVKLKVTVTDGKNTKTYKDWKVDEVDREGKNVKKFMAHYVSKKIKDQNWSKKSKVTVEVIESEIYDRQKYNFKVSKFKERVWLIPDTVEFKQVF